MLELDAARSNIRIRTYAEGLFARLAHDLELVCREPTGQADDGHATVTVPVDKIEVAGVLRGERVDPAVLSASDKADVLAKMRREVFASGDAVRVEAALEGKQANVKVMVPNRRALEKTIPVEVDGTRVRGRLDVSLSAIGAPVVKGPMNAFRVKDVVSISFDVVFAQPA